MELTEDKKHKILVVDDNHENIKVIGSILRQKTYQVGFATNGGQALDILEARDEAYDLVLLDVNMPGMNGFDVCKRIRQNHKLKDLPVIFLTANSDHQHIVEGFSSGGQDYVTKPFHAGELLARISTHLELKDSREQLKEVNALLEEKVMERTLKLRETNQRLEAAVNELGKLDEAKSDFLSIISHEVNTPLNGILGFANLLGNKLSSTDYYSYIENLTTSAQRLNEFAQTSLVITSMRTFPNKYKREVVDIKESIEDVVEKQKGILEKKGIQLVSNCSTPFTDIYGNKDLINTCFNHIIRNAINYTPIGRSIDLDIYSEKNHLIFSCKDSGPGFSSNSLDNLFKAFSPGEKHVDKNKGLGLSLVKMIVDFHHAEINIFNIREMGACVQVLFDHSR